MSRIRLAVVATATLMTITAASGCSGDDGGSSASASAPPTKASTKASAEASAEASAVTQAEEQAVVKTASSDDLGTILVDEKGRTLYLFEADESTTSTCDDECAEAWPPLLTSGEPSAEGSAQSDLLGTSKRSDGKTQVTYNDHPLYRYEEDTKPGDTNGQGLDEFGAEWFTLDADGEKVESDEAGEQGPPGY